MARVVIKRKNAVDPVTEISFVELSSSIPRAAGTASAGVSCEAARADHVHPVCGAATQSANGLMSAADKKKLDGIAAGATATAAPPAAAAAAPKAHGTAAVGTSAKYAREDHVHPSDNTDTHWTSHLYAGAANGNANAATANGATYLIICDNSTVRDRRLIKGAGSVTVASDASGNITISGTNTTYGAATQSANGLMSAADKKKLDGIAAGATATAAPPAAAAAAPKAHGTAAVGTSAKYAREDHVHPSNNTDTHWTSHLYAGASNGNANAATANGATHLIICDNSTVRDRRLIKGAGSVTVASDASGNITISGTNTWRGVQNNLTSTSTTESLSAAQGRALANGSARDSTKLPLAGGSMTGTINSSVGGTSWLNGNKGSAVINCTTATGSNYVALFKINSKNGVFVGAAYSDAFRLSYTSNTTINNGTNSSDKSAILLNENGDSSFPGKISAASFAGAAATQSVAGLMSAADKKKLDGISAGMKNFSWPIDLGNVANADVTMTRSGIFMIVLNGNPQTTTLLNSLSLTIYNADKSANWRISRASNDKVEGKYLPATLSFPVLKGWIVRPTVTYDYGRWKMLLFPND